VVPKGWRLALSVRGKDARYFQKRLGDANVVASAREGFLRFSPHVGNDEAEAERVLGLLKRL
jgi:hypothetical protein